MTTIAIVNITSLSITLIGMFIMIAADKDETPGWVADIIIWITSAAILVLLLTTYHIHFG